MKLRDPRVWLAVVSAALVVLLVVLDLERAAPGGLSPAHAAVGELAGAQGCAACHGEFGAELADGCLGCHAEIGRDVESGRALHGTLDAGRARRCEQCHAEHHGAELALVAARSFAQAGFAERADFDHPGLGFALEGRHDELECADCHELADAPHLQPGEHRFRGLAQRCEACHKDPHDGRLGAGCADCHGQSRPFAELAAFAHPASFPLRGAHARAACVDCHAQSGELAIASLAGGAPAPARTCVDCHASPHSEGFLARIASDLALAAEATCTACHEDADEGFERESVERARALHGAGGFELRAPHDALACAACHASGSTRPEAGAPLRGADDCAACHADPHAGEFGPGASARGGCLACHAHEEFRPARFGLEQHAALGFPLEGSHARADCAACHREASVPGGGTPRFTGLARDCASCHADAHAGAFEGRACADCHETGTFAATISGTFEHERATGFALEGAHARAACEACHRRADHPDVSGRRFGRVAELFGEPARDCSTCHADAHAGAFDGAEFAQLVDGRTGCARCHSSESFAAYPHGDFDHALWTGFALEGAHATAECSACHSAAPQADATGRRFGRAAEHFPAPRAGCAGCHADPHEGRFARGGATDCASCHSQASFRVEELDAFDHARWTGFALEGAHGRVDCSACHSIGASEERALGRVPGDRCADCHSDPHVGQFARGGSTDCARCHAGFERFTADGFDHARDSGFALDDTHARLACSACHVAWELADGRSAVRYKPLGRECAACHGGGER